MSSPESSAAPTESNATSQPSGEFAAAPSFGATRGSGLARGKRPANSPAASNTASASGYKPTAIEIVTAPREYQNPFAPTEAASVETPAEAIVASPVIIPPVSTPSAPSATVETPSPTALPEEKVELNILPPERARTAPAQTWESDGFKARPERSSRQDRFQQESSTDEASTDTSSVPAQFLYVRPGVDFVPTPRNWGGAPRERRPGSESSAPASRSAEVTSPSSPAPATKSTGGFFGWLKSLFGGGGEAATPVADDRTADRQRGGRGRNHSGQSSAGDRTGGGNRRHRGGRGRSGQRGGYRSGSSGGDATGA